jgi:hypothetical protein
MRNDFLSVPVPPDSDGCNRAYFYLLALSSSIQFTMNRYFGQQALAPTHFNSMFSRNQIYEKIDQLGVKVFTGILTNVLKCG